MPGTLHKRYSVQNPIKVFLVDDHPIILDGFRTIIMQMQLIGEPFALAGSALAVNEAVERITEDRENLPNLLLLDLWLRDIPWETGLDLIHALSKQNIHIPVLIYSGECVNSAMLAELLKAGISGYVMKTIELDILIKAMYAVAVGKTYFCPEVRKRMKEGITPLFSPLFPKLLTLTPNELLYLKYFAKGVPFPEIARKMEIVHSTLYSHGHGIKTKLGVEKLEHLNRKEINGMLAVIYGNDA